MLRSACGFSSVLALASVAGCAASDRVLAEPTAGSLHHDSGGGDAKRACEEVATLYCDSKVECAMRAGASRGAARGVRTRCEQAVSRQLRCDEVSVIATGLQACHDAVEQFDCAVVAQEFAWDQNSAPAVCAVFSTPAEDPPVFYDAPGGFPY